MQRLFLLDGMALVYRAHFALIRNPILTSSGVNTSALYGFINTLLYILEKENPSHLGVAFDTSAPTPRHKLYPEYKAQRDAMPEELAAAIPQVKRLLQAFKIPVIELDGWEADDLIGTLAHRADEKGEFETLMVTPDKDFAQLVSKHSSMWKPGRKGSDHEILGLREILEKWEIERPDQVIDILGLWGDASDNIPGVPGIGEKTAKKLVAQFGDIEGLLANTDQLKGKQKERVIENAEQARLSRQLATIVTDVPLDLDFESLKIEEPDEEAVKSLFTEFEFNALGKRLFGSDFQAGRGANTQSEASEQGELFSAQLKTLDDFKYDYQLVSDKAGLEAMITELSQAESLCFDVETTGLDVRQDELLGVAFSATPQKAYYVDLSGRLTLAQLKPLLQSEQEKIGHNLKFDLSVLAEQGLEVKGPFFDTMLVHSLVAPDQRHNMDFLAESLLGYQSIKLQELADDAAKAAASDELFALDKPTAPAAKKGKKKQPIDMRSIPLKALAKYAAEDADITLQLAEKLRPELQSSGMQALYAEIEAPLLPVLSRMERQGIAIDARTLHDASDKLGKRIDTLRQEIMEAAGEEFNLNSPKQLGQILFDKIQLVEKPKKTKTGQYVTNEQVLSSLAPKHEMVAQVLEYREASKLKSTYLDALPDHVSPKSGRIHTHYHQVLTATGRLASSDPNLQNIPIRTEAGRNIRQAFVPEKGGEFRLFAADYSQVELRVMAALANDPSMIEAFRQAADIHTATAAKVFGVAETEVTREMRGKAKMVNFGIIYGISAFGLSQRLSIPRGEAAEIIDSYFKQYPKVAEFMEITIETARSQGYVETLSGRRRYLPELNSSNNNIRTNAERAAINTPIQGTSADMIKLAMIRVDQHLRESDAQSRLLLQVHDELLFELHLNEAESLPAAVKSIMEEALKLPNGVPLLVESGLGNNWLEAH